MPPLPKQAPPVSIHKSGTVSDGLHRTRPVARQHGARGGKNRVALSSPVTSVNRMPPKRVRRFAGKEIGLMVLVLTAKTLSELDVLRDRSLSTEMIAGEYASTNSTPFLHNEETSYSHSSSAPLPPFVKGLLSTDSSEGVSTAGNSSSTDDLNEEEHQEEEELVPTLSPSVLSAVSARSHFLDDTGVWENILQYLPLTDVLRVRGVNKFIFCQSLSFIAAVRMPHTKEPAFFVPCREDLEVDEAEAEDALHVPQGVWTCSACGLFNGSSTFCNDARCQNERSVPGTRIFLGQLRRRGTVPMVRWLVNFVFNAPGGALVCVENHRHAVTRAGKGCAWPTISDEGTVRRILTYHHRMFFDNFGGVEGLWLVPTNKEGALAAEVEMRYAKSAHPKHMPRGTMVAELPSSTVVTRGAPATRKDALTGDNIPVSQETPAARAESLDVHLAFPQEYRHLRLGLKGRMPISLNNNEGSSTVQADYRGVISTAMGRHPKNVAIIATGPSTWRNNPYHPVFLS